MRGVEEKALIRHGRFEATQTATSEMFSGASITFTFSIFRINIWLLDKRVQSRSRNNRCEAQMGLPERAHCRQNGEDIGERFQCAICDRKIPFAVDFHSPR
jgi:hypothetical protein